MSNNTMNHVSDQASTVKFNPAGTQWASTVTDVQTALAQLGSWAMTTNGLPDATVNVKGVLRTCTIDDAKAGTSEDRAVTPKVLREYFLKPHASETEYGTTKYANAAERVDSGNNVTAITPQGLDYVFNNRKATEGQTGALRVATKAQAEAAAQDDVIMTPSKTLACINAHRGASPVPGTETVQGLVEIATVAEIQAGVANEGMAVSPKGFAGTRGTSTAYGTFKQAQDVDMTNLSATDSAITPWVLGRNKGTIGKFGIVKLSAAPSSEANTALASTAPVVMKNGTNQVMDQAPYVGDTKARSKLATVGEAKDVLPVGCVLMWPNNYIPAGFKVCDGTWLPKASYPELFRALGATYGEDTLSFKLPDFRGMFPRGVDLGRGIDSGRSVGSTQRCAIEYHKHIGGWGEAYDCEFGKTKERGYQGSRKTDNDNYLYFTNDGGVYRSNNPNASGVMSTETRPWNVAINFIIKVE